MRNRAFGVVLAAVAAAGATASAEEIFSDGFESGDADAWSSTVAPCPLNARCLEDPPIGWNGPAVIHLSDPATTPPTCSGDYPVTGTTIYSDLSVPAATCGCDCAEPTGVSCSGSETLANHQNDPTCTTFNPVAWDVASGCTSLGEAYSGGQYWTFDASSMAVSGGSCETLPTIDIPGASFSTRLVSCDGATPQPGSCTADLSCYPVAREPFENVMCIWRAGDLSCPSASTYDQRTVYYTGFDDLRDCSPCGCSTPSGDCLGSEVDLSNIDCDTLHGVVPGDGSCTLVSSGPAYAFLFNQVVDAECAPSGGGVTGVVQQIDVHTVCCTSS